MPSLQRMLAPTAQFRDGHWEAIDLATNQRQRLLVVQRAGWGKGVIYFLAAKILRDAGAGPALLISPLLALVRNQILAAGGLGIRAAIIHGIPMLFAFRVSGSLPLQYAGAHEKALARRAVARQFASRPRAGRNRHA